MPRVYFPEHRRRNAIRSRCAGSMLAWILNTKPDNAGSNGSTIRSRVSRSQRLGARDSLDRAILADPALIAGLVGVNAILEQVIDAAQLAPHADGPGNRRGADIEYLLDLVEEFDGLPAIAIELVDESHDRRVAQPATL